MTRVENRRRMRETRRRLSMSRMSIMKIGFPGMKTKACVPSSMDKLGKWKKDPIANNSD